MAEVCSHVTAEVYPHGEFYTLLREHSENYYDDSMFKKVQIKKFEENEGFNSEIFKVTAYDSSNNPHYMILKIPCVDKFLEKLEDAGQEVNESDGVNNEILNLTTNLAHLHSFSMFLPKESLKNLNLRGRFFDDCADLNPKFAEKTLAIFPQLRHYYEPFYNLIRSRQFAEYSVTGIAAELDMPEVIVHGDLFSNNILWKKNPDQTCSEEVGAIIDWQLIHAGCVAEDLAKILVVCTNTETRRLAEERVFNTYLEVLTNDLAEAGRAVPFTKQQLEKAYRLSFINQVFFLLFGISFFIQPNVFNTNSSQTKAKLAALASRAEYALIDSIQILENDLSRWML
ncbi:unnamed protein product [Enterobius vermicularis]|uniref:CHK domain-containing protein n=1 Tax=Enterobius vermicularis TaxID=51028 RepID=A0A0N4VFM3_ENTVE|nr:unnamed protein product [Enterobius vermicularis]